MRPATFSSGDWARLLITSSVRPSAKYSASCARLKVVNGSTATDLSGGPPSICSGPPRITPLTVAAVTPSTRPMPPSSMTSIRVSPVLGGASSPSGTVVR